MASAGDHRVAPGRAQDAACLIPSSIATNIGLAISLDERAMKTVPVYEAKNRFSELLAAVEQGETVSITRRGAPVTRLVAEPAAGKASRNEARKRVAAGFERLRVLRAGFSLDGDIRAIARQGSD